MKLSLLVLIKIELIDLNKLKFIACFKISDKFQFYEHLNIENDNKLSQLLERSDFCGD